MAKMKAGYIGFMPREGDRIQNFWSSLEDYAKIGYKVFENAGILFMGDLQENLKRIKDLGVEPFTIGYPRAMPGQPAPEIDAGKLAENAHAVGVSRVTTYGGCVMRARFTPGAVTPTYDEFMREVDEFEKLAVALKPEGVIVEYHNHDAEFEVDYKGVKAFDLMLACTDELKIELDCGWVTYAKEDPVEVLYRLGRGGRLGGVHLKDYVDGTLPPPPPRPGMPDLKDLPPIKPMPYFSAVGSGKLDLEGCLKASSELGMDCVIVEQDQLRNLNYHDTLQATYLLLKESGLVE